MELSQAGELRACLSSGSVLRVAPLLNCGNRDDVLSPKSGSKTLLVVKLSAVVSYSYNVF